MIGINKNRENKTRKNKKVKEGECIFPFKYKWKTHNECYPIEDGEICATEINPKTRTLVKYGYCKYSTSKSSSKKTIKKTTKKTIKKKSKEKMSKDDRENMSSEKEISKPMNRLIIDALGELNKIMMQKGEIFRARAYQKAQQEIFRYKKDITSVDDIKNLPNIGATIFEKLQELEKTGKIEAIERQKQLILEQEKTPENIFSKIYGVGPKCL